MTDEPTQEGPLSAELRELGKNLVEVLRAAWDQPERKRLQQEIMNGLNEMGTTIREETEKFSQSPTGQRLKTDVSNVTQRVQSGELESRGRQELLNALQVANQQIQRAIERLGERSTSNVSTQLASGGQSTGVGGTSSSSSGGPTGGESMTPNPNDPDYWEEIYPRSEGHKEVNPDDESSPPSDTGHNEVHPDDV